MIYRYRKDLISIELHSFWVIAKEPFLILKNSFGLILLKFHRPLSRHHYRFVRQTNSTF